MKKIKNNPAQADETVKTEEKHPFLETLGERVKHLRSRSGLTRKAVAQLAHMSERHLANLEYGLGNVSAIVLYDLSKALRCSVAELIGDVTTLTPEWLMLREMLENKSEDTLRRIRIAVSEMLDTGGLKGAGKQQRLALIGLRGAGKSTLGQMLAEELSYPFVELSREIEKFAGCSVSEIQGLYGMSAYRRYERRALEETIQLYQEVVIATPGGLVSDSASFNLLLGHCTTVWLKAAPEDHLQRVAAQGDMRPMAASKEALQDLRQILEGRAAFYSKADYTLNTSMQNLAQTFDLLKNTAREALQIVP